MYGIVNDSLQDAVVNTMKRANVSKYKPQSLIEPWVSTAGSGDAAMLQAGWMDPRATKFCWKEQRRMSFYNSSNIPVYMTVNRKRLRKSHDSNIANYPKSLLETFPQNYTITNQVSNATFLEWTPLNSQNAYDPTLANGGASALLVTPRQLGAWVEKLPYEPRPAFLQARAENLFNIGSNQFGLTGTITDQENSNQAAASGTFMAGIVFAGGRTYSPVIGSNYFTNRVNKAQQVSGAFVGTPAYTGMQFGTNETSYLDAVQQQYQYVTNSTSATLPSATYASVDMSQAKDYSEKRNKVLAKLFRMQERRYTIQPGTVLRLKFTSRKHCLTGTTLMRIKNITTPWFNLTGSGGANDKNVDRTLEAWSFGTYLPQHGGKASGYQEEYVSIALRGPHLPDSTASNSMNTAPAQLTVKHDHVIWTKLMAKPGRQLGPHRTVRDQQLVPAATNLRVMYKNPTAVSGPATSTNVAQQPQSTRPY